MEGLNDNLLTAAFYQGLEDELCKIAGMEKTAIDPVEIAGMLASAKIIYANLMKRHGTAVGNKIVDVGAKVPVLRNFAAEVLGAGVRAGAKGRHMVSRPARELLAAVGDPATVKAYEGAHRLGMMTGDAAKALSPREISRLRMADPAAAKAVKNFLQMARPDKVPITSSGPRKLIDFGHNTPGAAIKELAKALSK